MERNHSATIDYLRFGMTVIVLLLHAYTIVLTVGWLKTGHPVYQFLSYNLSLLVGNIAVPFFFFISGYLFYLQGKPDYFHKLKSRFYSLIIPYFLWNLLTIVLFYFLQHLPFTEGLFSGYHKLISDYTFGDFLRAFWDCGDWSQGNGKPLLFPYWYIRNLIVLILISPLIYWLNIYLKYYWLIMACLVWLLTPHLASSASSIFSFGIGAYLGINRVKINLSPGLFKAGLVVCIGLAGLLNFFLYHPVGNITPVVALRLFIICSVPVIYTIFYRKVEKGRWKIPQKWLNSTFFIYSSHIFIMMALRKGEIKLFPGASDGLSVFFYLSSVVITFFVSYGGYVLLRKYMPGFLAVLCGKRC